MTVVVSGAVSVPQFSVLSSFEIGQWLKLVVDCRWLRCSGRLACLNTAIGALLRLVCLDILLGL